MKFLQRAMAEATIVRPKGALPYIFNACDYNYSLSCSVLVISGTTAVGKTDLSILLARRLRGEIISADSAQVHCKHSSTAAVTTIQ